MRWTHPWAPWHVLRSPTMDHTQLVEVYRARDTTHAHLLCAQLEEAGISAVVQGEQLQAAVGGLPTGWASAPRLVVAGDEAERARTLLEQWETMPPCAVDADATGDDIESLSVPVLTSTRQPSSSPVVMQGFRRWYGHVVGGFSILWGAAAWLEWLLVPRLVAQRDGPAPYLDFAFFSLGLFFGCVWLTLQVLCFPMPLSWRSRLMYAAVPCSFVVYFLASLMLAIP